MKRFTKLLGSITLSTALVISSFAVAPDSSVAIQAAENNDSFEMTDSALFQAEYVNGIYTITGFDSLYNASSIVVPYELNGIPVRAIDAAFCGKTNCLTVYLPDSISIIGSKTFAASSVEYVKSYSNSKIKEIIAQPIAGEIETGSIDIPVPETPEIDTGNAGISQEKPELSILCVSLKTIEDNAFKDSKTRVLLS